MRIMKFMMMFFIIIELIIFYKEIFVKEKSFSDYLFTPIGFTVLCIVLMAAWYIYKFTNKVEKLDLSKVYLLINFNE